MAETVGRVDFIAGLDGRNVVRQSRELGERIGKAGDDAGSDFGDNFDRELTPRMLAAGQRAAKALTAGLKIPKGVIGNDAVDVDGFANAISRVDSSFNDSVSRMTEDTQRFRLIFDEMSTDIERRSTGIAKISKEVDFGRWSEDAGTFRQVFRELEGDVDRLSITAGQNTLVWHENQRAIEAVTDSLGGIGRGGDGVADSFRRIGDDGGESIRKTSGWLRNLWDGIDEGTPRLRKMNLQWSDLSHNTRQWTLIIGAVLAGMQDLAVLSSAAGAGLFAVGGALTAALAGVGGSIAVFSVLAKDIGDLPPELRETATQFKALGSELTRTRDIIASSAIQQMPSTFASLRGTVQGLNPVFSALGTSIGNTFDDLAEGLKIGTPGFKELNGLIGNAADDFPALASAAGTWSVGLLRGLNKANPLVDQLIGYVEKLGDRFEEFTRSSSFDQWVSNSSQTFKVFGELLDATARALNDLVTPESIIRTQRFMENLTGFMPNLSKLLDILGRLDVFGLLAQGLNDFGEALSPLAGPMADLASETSAVASILIGELATALGVVAQVVGPVAQSLADLLGAMPPGVVAAIATGVIGLAAAFNILRGVQGIAGAASVALTAADNFGVLAGATGRTATAAGKLATGIGAFAGKAGIFGLAATGAFLLFDGLVQLTRKMSGIDDETRRLIATNSSFAESFDSIADKLGQSYLNPYIGDSIKQIDNMDSALTKLGDNDFALMLTDDFDEGARGAGRLKIVLGELDGPLAALAGTNMEAATGQFSAWANELGASDAQILNMINRMPEFKGALEAATGSTAGFATDQQLLDAALGITRVRIDEQANGLSLLAGGMTFAGDSVDILGEKIRLFGENNLGARDAARTYQEQIQALTDSIAANGTNLDISTAAGRANEEAIDALAIATLDLADKTRTQTGDQAAANAVIQTGRDKLIEQMQQFGLTSDEAAAYVDQLGLIVPDVSTAINTPGLQAAVDGAATLDDQIRRIPKRWETQIVTIYSVVGDALKGVADLMPKTAIGGRFDGAQARIIAEDGPEAVVPLNRPLSQVDPSVRWLSGVAQGLISPASGGGGGGGRTVIFEAGAIVVEGAEDSRQTAYDVFNVVAENIGS